MFIGAFRPSLPVRIGQVRYARRPVRLTNGQKSRVRRRLREVDDVVAVIQASNAKCPSLVCYIEVSPRFNSYSFILCFHVVVVVVMMITTITMVMK